MKMFYYELFCFISEYSNNTWEFFYEYLDISPGGDYPICINSTSF